LDPYSHHGYGTVHTRRASPQWGEYAQGWSSWAWALCAHGPPSGPWALYCAYDSGHTQVKHHYGKVAYPSPSHLDKDPYDGWTAVVGVGLARRQLQQQGTGGPLGFSRFLCETGGLREANDA